MQNAIRTTEGERETVGERSKWSKTWAREGEIETERIGKEGRPAKGRTKGKNDQYTGFVSKFTIIL